MSLLTTSFLVFLSPSAPPSACSAHVPAIDILPVSDLLTEVIRWRDRDVDANISAMLGHVVNRPAEELARCTPFELMMAADILTNEREISDEDGLNQLLCEFIENVISHHVDCVHRPPSTPNLEPSQRHMWAPAKLVFRSQPHSHVVLYDDVVTWSWWRTACELVTVLSGVALIDGMQVHTCFTHVALIFTRSVLATLHQLSTTRSSSNSSPRDMSSSWSATLTSPVLWYLSACCASVINRMPYYQSIVASGVPVYETRIAKMCMWAARCVYCAPICPLSWSCCVAWNPVCELHASGAVADAVVRMDHLCEAVAKSLLFFPRSCGSVLVHFLTCSQRMPGL